MTVIEHGEADLRKISVATHYRSSHGDVSEIKKKESQCHCGRPTKITTQTGWWSTFTRAHMMDGCFEALR